MAIPYLSNFNAEQGDKGHFESETDTGARLDFPHYSDLAREPGVSMPYNGAYCLRVDLAKSTNDAYLEETGSWDTSAAGTIYFRWMLWIHPGITMANNDQFNILLLQSAGPVSEVVAGLIYTTAGGLKFGVGETAITSSLPIQTGKWIPVEVKAVIDSGVGNDGTIAYWVNGVAGTQVASLDQGAITQGRFGVVGQDAGTTAGVLLMDDLIADDARIYWPAERFPSMVPINATGHIFVGPGSVEGLSLLTTTSGDNIKLYDTDVAYTSDATSAVFEVDASNLVSMSGPVYFHRGCYAVVTGSSCRGQVFLTRNWQKPGVTPPKYYNEAGMRRYGQLRKARLGNV